MIYLALRSSLVLTWAAFSFRIHPNDDGANPQFFCTGSFILSAKPCRREQINPWAGQCLCRQTGLSHQAARAVSSGGCELYELYETVISWEK